MEHRRTQRFALQLPVSIIRTGSERISGSGLTRNISSGGVLFLSEREPELGEPIEYVVTLQRDDLRPVNLRCVGKVLRYERTDEDGTPPVFSVAATLERYEFIRP